MLSDFGQVIITDADYIVEVNGSYRLLIFFYVLKERGKIFSTEMSGRKIRSVKKFVGNHL